MTIVNVINNSAKRHLPNKNFLSKSDFKANTIAIADFHIHLLISKIQLLHVTEVLEIILLYEAIPDNMCDQLRKGSALMKLRGNSTYNGTEGKLIE